MTRIETVATGGHGLALLEAQIRNDTGMLVLLAKTFDPTDIVDSAIVFAGYLAQRAATGLTVGGEPLDDESDSGLWHVFDVAAKMGHGPIAEDPELAAISHIYEARDLFLTGIASCLGDVVPGDDGAIEVDVRFWDGWENEDALDVIIGVGMALERLFYFDMVTELEEDDDTESFNVTVSRAFAEYRQAIAAASA